MTPGLVIKEGRRLRLRQLQEDDIPHWVQANGCSKQEGKTIYAQELEKPDGPPCGASKQFGVESLVGEWIGFTGFGAEPGGDAGGYFFIDPAFRGRGYGEELVRCVLDVMFRDCAAARCIIDYHDWNETGARLYAKLGFEEIDRIRIPDDRLTREDGQRADGRPVYAVILSLTRERFVAEGNADVQSPWRSWAGEGD